MKGRRISAKWIFLAVVLTLVAMAFDYVRIDPGFATSAYLRFDYGDKHIHRRITDPQDFAALRGMLRGYSSYQYDVPACGYSEDVSITLTDGHRSITFCPADDGDDGLRIGSSNRYLYLEERQKEFVSIVRKYGMPVHCREIP